MDTMIRFVSNGLSGVPCGRLPLSKLSFAMSCKMGCMCCIFISTAKGNTVDIAVVMSSNVQVGKKFFISSFKNHLL